MHKILLLIITCSFLMILAACEKPDDNTPSTEVTYQKITAEEAKSMMEQDSSIIILDVRRQDEYDQGHIPNAILIPDYEIKELAESILNSLDMNILVFVGDFQARSKIYKFI